ncbi:MmgE/PrpD family protein [Arthrobacter sp. I2-34]|uniref:MmgE/PrpD family protein n=1 Tax=Arthrobacter hankyongi TaxID=2904801 RepID=A0ABS9L482_9MICC|nr:MmgE/PrpD family protein [Arthrobacter hankyongi]MCG2621307.1 MmgE/PrpD family protein [Arthrobacter hankyongi]
MSYTQTLARFAAATRFEDLPDAARRAGKLLIKDTLACAVAGHEVPSSTLINRVVGSYGGTPEATVLVTGQKLPAALAAHINSHLSNAIDADDTIHYKAHVAAGVVAPALAVAEREGSSSQDLLAAVILGYDVAGRIAMSLRSLVVNEQGELQFAQVSGYSSVVFGATVAAGRLLGLDPDQMRHAFGIAAASAPLPSSSQFGRELPRPMTKYALYGALGEAGVTAALLAREGFTAEQSVLDGDRGFWRVVGSVDCNWEALTGRLGERWLVEEVTYKPYPACRFLNAAIDMFRDLRRRHNLDIEDIEGIEVGLHGAALSKHMDNPVVETAVDAFFSLPYLLSAAAFCGEPGPNWHTEEARSNEAMKAFARKVKVGLEPRAAAAASEDLAKYGHNVRMPSSVSITAGGAVYSDSRNFAYGDPYSEDTRFTDADADRKFRTFCSGVLSGTRIDAALELLDALDSGVSVADLASQLVSEREASLVTAGATATALTDLP